MNTNGQLQGESIMSGPQERSIAAILDRVRRAKPRLKMLEVLGRPDEELSVRIQHLEQACTGALELNELAKAGQL